MLEDAALMKDLSDQERLMFQTEMNTRRKNPTTGVLLTLFLGGLGAHRFYLGQTGLGILYLVFVWTFIPAIAALIECFLMSGRVRAYNTAIGQETAIKLKGLRPGAESATSALPPAASQSGGRTLPAAAAGAAVGATAARALGGADAAEPVETLESGDGGGLAALLGDE